MINIFSRELTEDMINVSEIFEHNVVKTFSSPQSETCICLVKVDVKETCPKLLAHLINEYALRTDADTVFQGSSTRHSKDKYIAYKGQDLAEHKAMAKAFEFEYRALRDVFETLYFASAQISNFLNKTREKRDKQLQCIANKM